MRLAVGSIICAILALSAGCAVETEGSPEPLGVAEQPARPLPGNGIANEIFPWSYPSLGQRHATTPLHSYQDLNNNAVLPGNYQDELIRSGQQIAASVLGATLNITYSPSPRPLNQDEWRARTRKFGIFMDHVTKCALSSSDTVVLTVTDGGGVYAAYTQTLTGQLGLATSWRTGNISSNTSAQQVVTACLLALTNKDGYTVGVSIRAPDDYVSLGADAAEKSNFKYIEGAFWGNAFSSTPWHRACYSGNTTSQALARRLGRNCSGSDSADKCNEIEVRGACDSICTEDYNEDTTGNPSFVYRAAGGATNTLGYTQCEGVDQVTTVFVDDVNSTSGNFQSSDNQGWQSSNWIRCGTDQYLAGIAVGYGDIVSALCRKDPRLKSADANTYSLNFVPDVDVSRSTRARWMTNSAQHFIGCDDDEYISGIEVSWGHVKTVECKKAYIRGDRCRGIDRSMAASTRRANDASATWWRNSSDSGNVPVECDLNERMTSVVFESGSDPSQIGGLCCAF